MWPPLQVIIIGGEKLRVLLVCQQNAQHKSLNLTLSTANSKTKIVQFALKPPSSHLSGTERKGCWSRRLTGANMAAAVTPTEASTLRLNYESKLRNFSFPHECNKKQRNKSAAGGCQRCRVPPSHHNTNNNKDINKKMLLSVLEAVRQPRPVIMFWMKPLWGGGGGGSYGSQQMIGSGVSSVCRICPDLRATSTRLQGFKFLTE